MTAYTESILGPGERTQYRPGYLRECKLGKAIARSNLWEIEHPDFEVQACFDHIAESLKCCQKQPLTAFAKHHLSKVFGFEELSLSGLALE